MTRDRNHMDCWSGPGLECFLKDPDCPMHPAQWLQRLQPADPDRACPHEHFVAVVGVNRITDADDGPVVAYSADVTVSCAQCEEKFRFIGVQAGLSPAKPMCSMDEFELHIPIRPASADPDFGLGIPGYAINYRRPEES